MFKLIAQRTVGFVFVIGMVSLFFIPLIQWFDIRDHFILAGAGLLAIGMAAWLWKAAGFE